MNKFNKLYNLILQSIISQNKESRRAMVQKSENIPYYQKTKILIFLSRLNNNKAADFLCKFFCTGQLKDIEDKRIKQVLTILANKSSIDTSKTVDLESFIKQHSSILKKVEQKVSVYNLDKIPQLSQKKDYGNGVVVYKIEDNKKGLKALRKIVDNHWGKNANPWCLVAREGFDFSSYSSPWHYWCDYSTYPKHVAFQNGKLLAFSANDNETTVWWDRNDEDHEELIWYSKDGSYNYIKTQQYKPYTFEQKIKMLGEYDSETGRYNFDGNLTIKDKDLKNGHFLLPLGKIIGDFICSECDTLKDLTNGPTEVSGFYYCSHCENLQSLKGAPQKVGENFDCQSCPKITSLQDVPKETLKHIVCMGCTGLDPKEQLLYSLNSVCLKYIQKEDRYDYNGSIRIWHSFLKDGKLPIKFRKVKGFFTFEDCPNLKSLQGCPEYVGQYFDCSNTKIKTLEGGPIYVGNNYYCQYCSKLISLKGAPKRLTNGSFNLEGCKRLTSLEFAPIQVDRTFSCEGTAITSLQGAPRTVGGNFTARNCQKLKSLKGLPKYIGLDLDCSYSKVIDFNSIIEDIVKSKISGDICLDEVFKSIKGNIPKQIRRKVSFW